MTSTAAPYVDPGAEALLARAATPRRALFLDRDGVINVDHGYVHKVEHFQFIPGSDAAMARLQAAGWRLVVVTNQSGLARGLYSIGDYERFTAHLRQQLAGAGVRLDAVLHCPHLADAAVPAYRLSCDCRKPGPGMLLQAARELSLDMAASAIVGDRLTDVLAGRAAGVGHCALVRSGVALEPGDERRADAVYDNLAAFTSAWLSGHAHGRGAA
jgi:D-glycero-D-manno-heptose 1,7-bisphosphate phosphatase